MKQPLFPVVTASVALAAWGCTSAWTTTLRTPLPRVAEAYCVEYTLLQQPLVDTAGTTVDSWQGYELVMAHPPVAAPPPPTIEVAFAGEGGGGTVTQMLDVEHRPFVTISWTWTGVRPTAGEVERVEAALVGYLRLMGDECAGTQLDDRDMAVVRSWEPLERPH